MKKLWAAWRAKLAPAKETAPSPADGSIDVRIEAGSERAHCTRSITEVGREIGQSVAGNAGYAAVRALLGDELKGWSEQGLRHIGRAKIKVDVEWGSNESAEQSYLRTASGNGAEAWLATQVRTHGHRVEEERERERLRPS